MEVALYGLVERGESSLAVFFWPTYPLWPRFCRNPNHSLRKKFSIIRITQHAICVIIDDVAAERIVHTQIAKCNRIQEFDGQYETCVGRSLGRERSSQDQYSSKNWPQRGEGAAQGSNIRDKGQSIDPYMMNRSDVTVLCHLF